MVPACCPPAKQCIAPARRSGQQPSRLRRRVAVGRGAPTVAITVTFLDAAGATVGRAEADSGDSLLAVSYGAGAPIPTGCGSGSCGTCEARRPRISAPHSPLRQWMLSEPLCCLQVEMTVDGEAGAEVVRACTTQLPRGVAAVTVAPLPEDALWGSSST